MDFINWQQGKFQKKKSFLHGAPFVGQHCRVLKNTRSILAHRTIDVCIDEWRKLGVGTRDLIPFLLGVYHVVYPFTKWPTCYFLPLDRASIILGQIPGVWYDPEDIVKDLNTYFAWGREKMECIDSILLDDMSVEVLYRAGEGEWRGGGS